MEALTGLDAAFLYLETPNAPMHVGGIVFVDGGETGFDFAQYRSLIESRMHLSRVFRRRLVELPLSVGRPFWVEDPNFDLDSHLQHAALPAPGGWEQLRALAEHVFRLPLDLRRPLWSMTFVEGLDGIGRLPPGSFAIIHKIHHAAVDGMGAMDLWSALWDPTPAIRDVPKARRWRPDPLPGPVSLLRHTATQLLGSPASLVQAGSALLKGGLSMGRQLAGRHRVSVTAPFSAPNTRFNVPITPKRVFDALFVSLDSVKAIKNAVPGSTVNDAVLAICAGALRDYLAERAQLPKRSLVAMSPISVRGDSGGDGNEVSAMLVPLATDVADPLSRLRAIHDAAAGSKTLAGALGANTLMDAMQVVPFSMGAAAARLYTRMDLARYHRPPFNLIITNVPGPRVPLYLGGRRMHGACGMAPVVDGLGLIIVVTSYLDELVISVTSCPDVLPDIAEFIAHLRQSFDRLLDAADSGMARKASNAPAPRKRRAAAKRTAKKPRTKKRPGTTKAGKKAGSKTRRSKPVDITPAD